MDRTQVVTESIRDDEIIDKKRVSWLHQMLCAQTLTTLPLVSSQFESFRLGRGLPSSNSGPSHTRPSHSRSHSRNLSVSSSPSLSISLSHNSMNDMPSLSSSISSQSLGSINNKRPNSHHRRRSSVSTRRESAEMMGVSLPELSPSHSDENINLGDKDSVRRRALWALEGKTDLRPFSKVEIPELNTPEIERRMADFRACTQHSDYIMLMSRQSSEQAVFPSWLWKRLRHWP